MANYLSPGVYIEEFDSSPRAIEGVSTSTAGFIGMTVRGPVQGAPSLCTSFADFTRQFGGYLSEYTHGPYRFLPQCVSHFFQNGGTRCFISRVAPEDAATASIQREFLSLKAANEGKWGNRIVVRLELANRRKLQLIRKEGDCSYEARSATGFAEGDLMEFEGELNRISTIFQNTITFEKDFAGNPVDSALVPQTVLYALDIDVSIQYEDELEQFSGCTLNPTAPSYLSKRLAASRLVVSELHEPPEGLVNPLSALFGENERSGSLTLGGGGDGTMDAVNAGVYIGTDGGPGKRTGICSFCENSTASIIAVPGITMPDVLVSLVAHCESEKNRFAILDIPQELVRPAEIIQFRSVVDSSYAAFYHPWIQAFDPLAKRSGFFPPSGAVAGVYARTDVARGVHKAPANETVAGCTGLSVLYTTGEQEDLNPAGVNLIRALPGQGIRVWGARTASSNSAFKYINVRRLFIYVEQSIQNATNWVVFEPNNASLWSRVRMTISSFLEGLFRSGMLSGENAAEAFYVDIGPNTMSQDDIMNGRLICEIGIAPSRPAEFVIFRVTQYTAESGTAE